MAEVLRIIIVDGNVVISKSNLPARRFCIFGQIPLLRGKDLARWSDMIFPNNQLLKIPMYLSSTVGIWPIIFMENKRMKKIYDVFATIYYYYYLEYIFRAYYQLTVLLRAEHLNVEEILGNLCITLIYTVSLLRLKAFSTPEVKTLFANIIAVENEVMRDTDSRVRSIYMSCVRNNKIYNVLFFFNGWVVSFLYFLHPFFMELPTMVIHNETITLSTLPLSTWWPIDIQKHYWFAYCWNVFDGTLGSSYVINSDMLTFSLIVFALSQLNILSYRLRHFKRGVRAHETSQAVDAYYKRKFIHLVKEHQKIITYIDTFNEAMKYVMLFDFLQCSIQLATITLQLLVMEINIQNVFFVGEFMLTMIIRLVIYYFNANEIIFQSQNLALDVWRTDWYRHSDDLKKSIEFFMARAQKPLKFLIGPFAVMSLETFIAILKATYSYMMLFINTSE